MRNYVYPTTEHVMKITDFKTKRSANLAIKTLKWLDNGAPEKVKKIDKKIIFNMSSFYNYDISCETTCCIAGAMQTFDKTKDFEKYSVEEYICSGLNLTYSNKLNKLFYGSSRYGSSRIDNHLKEITVFEAATLLRKYLKNGVVDWSHVKNKNLKKRYEKKYKF